MEPFIDLGIAARDLVHNSDRFVDPLANAHLNTLSREPPAIRCWLRLVREVRLDYPPKFGCRLGQLRGSAAGCPVLDVKRT